MNYMIAIIGGGGEGLCVDRGEYANILHIPLLLFMLNQFPPFL